MPSYRFTRNLIFRHFKNKDPACPFAEIQSLAKKTEQLITLGHSQVKLALARALLTGDVAP